jgi:hypothetical protein
MRRSWVLALSCGVSACLFPSLDALTDGDAQAVDASTEASSGDASSDATSSDANASDAPLGDSTLGDADAGPFCAQHPTATFCADFDESADAATGFTSTYLTSGGVVSLDTSASASPPASLLAGDTTLTNGASAHGALVKSTGATPSIGITFDFDLRVDKLATQGSYIEALAIVINAATKSSIQLNLKAASSEVGEEVVGLDGGQTYTGHLFPAPVALNKWMHVTIALAFGAPRSVTVTVDTSVVVDHAPLSAAFSTAGPVELYLGNAYAPGPSDGATIHYDDAVLVVN